MATSFPSSANLDRTQQHRLAQRRRTDFWLAILFALAIMGWAVKLAEAEIPEHRARIKDISSIEGIRDNQLVGYGLVVGLQGTGD